MKRILKLFVSVNFISLTSTTVVACGNEDFNNIIDKIYSFINQSFIDRNKVYYSNQEIYSEFKNIVDSFSNKKISITYNKNLKPKENFYLVSLKELNNENNEKYTKTFLLEIFFLKEERWSDTSAIGSEALIKLNFGIKKNGIKLSETNFITKSGQKYQTSILNINEISNLKFSFNSLNDYQERLSSNEVEVWNENDKIFFEPKYNSFELEIYIQATTKKNINEVYDAQISIENFENDNNILLNEQTKLDFVYPANREITWKVENYKDIQGIKKIYSNDSNFELISIDDKKGLIKTIYNSNSDEIMVDLVEFTIIPNNTSYKTYSKFLNIYPDNMYLTDIQNQPLPEIIEINETNTLLTYKIINYDERKVKYKIENEFKDIDVRITPSANSTAFLFIQQKNVKWIANTIYTFYLIPERSNYNFEYYEKIKLNIKVLTSF